MKEPKEGGVGYVDSGLVSLQVKGVPSLGIGWPSDVSLSKVSKAPDIKASELKDTLNTMSLAELSYKVN